MLNSTSDQSQDSYGKKDASYQAAGGEQGLRQLCTDFYRNMDEFPEAKGIRAMHEANLDEMIEKLTLFLCMWLGGPKTYRERYEFVGMPKAHKNFVINAPEEDAWLLCMDRAIEKQNQFKESFKTYLKAQLRVPAELIRKTSRNE